MQILWHDALLPVRDCCSRREVEQQLLTVKAAVTQLQYVVHEVLPLERCLVMAYWSASGEDRLLHHHKDITSVNPGLRLD